MHVEYQLIAGRGFRLVGGRERHLRGCLARFTVSRGGGRDTGWLKRGAAVVMVAAGIGQLSLSIVVLAVP